MRHLHLTLRWQLLLSYVPIILIPILITGLVVRSVAERSLSVLITQEAKQRAVTVSGVFIQYYALHNNSWAGVEAVFQTLRPNNPHLPPGIQAAPPIAGNKRPPGYPTSDDPAREAGPGHFLITDANGVVVASEDGSLKGQILAASSLAQGAPLTINNLLIGTLVIGAPDAMLGIEEKQLLETVSSALLLTGLFTAIGVTLLGLWLSGQLTAPVRDLMGGVKQLASGHWSTPVTIRSQNELADLTRAFNGMAEQLTRQQQQQRQMIADIAHDLRTPLSVMTLEIAGIRAGLQSPEEATRSLEEEIGWLQHLIDDLHTLSLMDTGRFALHLDDTALTPYLTGLGAQWQPMATQREKTLICDIPADLPIVQIDAYRIRQVLGNLLNNAFQHTPPGTQVVLRAAATADQVTISVIDNGPGIPADELAHLFERFYRADRARHRTGHGDGHEQGSGLGLSIAYQLALLHHGTLSVQSRLDLGTTFELRLPGHKSYTSRESPHSRKVLY